MRLGTITLAIFGILPTGASAIETYSSSQFHQVIAKAVVPDRDNQQQYFSVVGTFWAREVARYAAGDGVYYQFSGHSPSDEAATKLLFLVLNRSEKEWIMPPREGHSCQCPAPAGPIKNTRRGHDIADPNRSHHVLVVYDTWGSRHVPDGNAAGTL
jgi:hypothetical protein